MRHMQQHNYACSLRFPLHLARTWPLGLTMNAATTPNIPKFADVIMIVFPLRVRQTQRHLLRTFPNKILSPLICLANMNYFYVSCNARPYCVWYLFFRSAFQYTMMLIIWTQMYMKFVFYIWSEINIRILSLILSLFSVFLVLVMAQVFLIILFEERTYFSTFMITLLAPVKSCFL